MPERLNILDTIQHNRKLQVEDLKRSYPLEQIKSNLPDQDAFVFSRSLSQSGIRIIAELKKSSPSKGILSDQFDVPTLSRAYQEGGAAAISVLTEPTFFSGRFESLAQAREMSGLPVLCKDFVVDSYQIYHARAMKADAILLICRMLTDRQLHEWIEIAQNLGMDTLVEVHSDTECTQAVSAGATIIGINARDLSTFEIDRELPVRLRTLLPSHVTVVAESGVRNAEDISYFSTHGFRHFLVGETLMKSDNPTDTLRLLTRT